MADVTGACPALNLILKFMACATMQATAARLEALENDFTVIDPLGGGGRDSDDEDFVLEEESDEGGWDY